jgi:SpoIID/LytB domain protein
VCLGVLLPAAPSGAAEPVFTFLGGGYGHSVGMSQYGAYGMAREGYTWEQILSHYFTGASPAPADPALLAAPLWVGLTQERTRIELAVVATGGAPAAPVTFTQGDGSLVAAGGGTVVVERLSGGTCRVSGPGGPIEGPCFIDAAWDGDAAEPTTALEIVGCTLPDWNAPGGTVWRPCRYARGSLHIRPDDDTGFDVSLEIGLEAYILGISESPYYWGTMGAQAALEAQAVAARSYALHRAIERGDPASRPWCWCQVYDTTVDQFYAGWGHGTQTWLDAVAATAGQVMVHPSETRDGALIPIETFYSSSTLGWTEDSENGFGAYIPYLRAVDDHWGRLASTGNPNARWSREFSAADLAARLPGMRTVTGATITRCSATGAALEITFTGEGGPRAFTTRDLRSNLGLRSMQVYNVGSPPPATPPCSGPALGPAEPGGPAALADLTLDDDPSGDSEGDGDGVAECGEVIEVFTIVANEGLPLAGVAANLNSADPYVTVRWNTTSAFPDLDAGASAANTDDWDLAIAASTPPGYTAHLALQVTALNGGPWDLDVALPLSCGGPLEGALAAPGDIDGDGRGDAAVAYARDGRAPALRFYSAASGSVLAEAPLGPVGYLPIDAVAVPATTALPAAVAVLLRGPDGTARVVVADTSGHRRFSAALAPGSDYRHIEVLPAAEGGNPTLLVLAVTPDGAVRVVRRDAATGARLSPVRFGRAVDPVALAVVPASADGPRLAVIGRGAGGLRAVVRSLDGRLVTRMRLSETLEARDAAVVAGSGGRFLLAVAAASPAGEVSLIVADPVSGKGRRTFAVANLTEVRDLAALPRKAGSRWGTVALLGTAGDGTLVATVADPRTGSLLAAPEFPGAYPADEVAVLGAGGVLAALSRAPGDGSMVFLRHAVSGIDLGGFPVP